MESVNIYEAKTHLSKLVDQAIDGDEVVIARGGKPLVRLVPVGTEKRPIRFGVLKDQVRVGDDFDAPLPDTVLAGFEGR